MALQLGATRDAFLAANVPPDKANAAAEELAGFTDRFARIDGEMSDIRGDIKLLKWMVGGVYPLIIAILLKLFIP